MKIGTKLAEARKNSGKKQTEVAEVLKVSRQMIYQYEHDQAEPDYDKLQIMSDLYGVPISIFLSEDNTILDENTKNELFDKIVEGFIYEGLLDDDSLKSLDEEKRNRLIASMDRYINNLSKK